jgi:AcrR family transcriptional regulator
MPRVAAKDRDAFIEARQQEILDAALKLWSEQGYDATSMEAIGREVGLTKGTLYLYFESKTALLDALVRRYSLAPDMAFLVERFRDRPLEEVVGFVVETAWSRLNEREDLVRLMLRQLPSHAEHAQHFVERVVLPTSRLFADYLEEKLGPERARQIDTRVAARSLLSMVLVFFVTQRLFGAEKLEAVAPRRVTDTISEIFLNGVRGDAAAAETS